MLIGGYTMYKDIPLTEFDETKTAIIEPAKVIEPINSMPDYCVICFYKEIIERLADEGKAELLAKDRTEMGFHYIYEMEYKGKRIALLHPGIGAPLASYLFEVVIAMGAKKFIACGGAGVLNKEIAVGHLVIPSSAVRDEGTSFHYLPAGREVEADKEVIEIIKSSIEDNKCQYVIGKTWTTDAIFRETYKKVQLRKSEGCLTVEMECAAFLAVAKFRGVKFGQILSGGDDVSCEVWDSRGSVDRKSIREKVFWISVEACSRL